MVEAIKAQADRYLHQCFMVGTYEPFVDVCKRLAELSPCGDGEQRSILVNSGAEAVENAVKIARAATGRPAVVVFENAFHGRTLLAMTMTAKVMPYKKGFGPFAPEVYRAPAPYPYRGVSSDDAIAGLEELFLASVDPETVACVVLEPVQGEGGFIPMPAGLPGAAPGALPQARDPVRGRRGAGRRRPHRAGCGRSSTTTASSRTSSSPGKSLGGGLPLAGVTGRAEVMDAVHAGGLGGTFSGNPLSCAAAQAVLEIVTEPDFLDAATRLGDTLRARLEDIAARRAEIGEVRGLGPMLAFEFVEQSPDRAKAVVAEAFERGLVLLSCGLYGNVIRLLPPLTISDEELDEGLALLEESLAAGD